jgi:hypothetical protein
MSGSLTTVTLSSLDRPAEAEDDALLPAVQGGQTVALTVQAITDRAKATILTDIGGAQAAAEGAAGQAGAARNDAEAAATAATTSAEGAGAAAGTAISARDAAQGAASSAATSAISAETAAGVATAARNQAEAYALATSEDSAAAAAARDAAKELASSAAAAAAAGLTERQKAEAAAALASGVQDLVDSLVTAEDLAEMHATVAAAEEAAQTARTLAGAAEDHAASAAMASEAAGASSAEAGAARAAADQARDVAVSVAGEAVITAAAAINGTTPAISAPGGLVMDAEGGPAFLNLAPGAKRALVAGFVDPATFTLRYGLVLDDEARAFRLGEGYSFAVPQAEVDELTVPGEVVLGESRLLVSLPDGERAAAALGAEVELLGLDTQSHTVRLHVPAASHLLPAAALAHRAGAVHLQAAPRPAPLGGTLTGPGIVLQGAALRPYAARTHQMIPAIARVGSRLWCAWFGWDGNLGNPYGEQEGTYIILAYSDDAGATWTEAVHIQPNDMAQDRLFDPQLFVWYGRLWVLYAGAGSSASEDHDLWLPCFAAAINNPLSSLRFEVTAPAFIGHGVPGRPFAFNGQPHGVLDVWPQHGGYAGPSPVVGAGSRFGRLHLDDPLGPWFEVIAIIPEPADPAEWDYNETALVALGGNALWGLRRTNSGAFALSTTDAGRSWASPALWGGFTPTSDSRDAVNRSPTGRLVACVCGSSPPVRGNLTLALSEDDGATWPYSYNLWPSTTRAPSYPSLDFDDGGNVLVAFDEGRGQNVSGIKNIRLATIPEASVVAGAGSVTHTLISE